MSTSGNVNVGRAAWADLALVLCVAGVSFLNSFFSGALTASLPTIQKDLQISSGNLAWSVTMYSVVLGSFLLPAGRLADVYGKRLLFLGGTTFFSLLSVCIALSPDWKAFTSFCALLALGAATNTPSGVGVLGAYFDAGEAKNRAFAALGAGQPMGFIAGLVLGALMTETKIGWRASFFAQGALAALFVGIAFFTIPSNFPLEVRPTSIPLESIAPDSDTQPVPRDLLRNDSPLENLGVDWLGIVLSTSGLVMLTFALADAPSEPRGWATPFLPPLIPIALGLLGAFFYWQLYLERQEKVYNEQRDTSVVSLPPPPPLISPRIWKAPFLRTILAIVFMAWSSFNTSSYYINLIIQLVLEKTPLQTALYFLPMVACGTLLNLIPGFLLSRVDGKALIVLSMALSVVGPILIACMDVKSPYWQFVFPIMIFLPAPDLQYAISAVQISKSVSRTQQASAGALFSVVTRLATAMSLGIISTISNTVSDKYLQTHPLDGSTATSPDVLMAGYRIGGGWACFACALAGLIISAIGLRGMGVVGLKEEPPLTSETVQGDVRGLRRRARATEIATRTESPEPFRS